MSQNALHSISIAIPHGTQQLRYSFVAKKNHLKMYPRLVPKSSPKCFQIVQFRKHQGSNSGGSPKNDFSSILGTSFGAGNTPQIAPKIKTFSGVPQELVLCDGSSQNAPKLPPKWTPKSTFFSGGAKLENLALASTGA